MGVGSCFRWHFRSHFRGCLQREKECGHQERYQPILGLVRCSTGNRDCNCSIVELMISAIFILLAVFFNAVCDAVENENFFESIFKNLPRQFWYKRESW